MKTLYRSLLILMTVALSAGLATAAPESYAVDKAHSTLLFRAGHLDVGYVYGRFNDFDGRIVVDDANPANSSVELTAQVQSVDTGNEKRDQHLRSPDFFNVAQFPTMSFRSTSVTKTADGIDVTGRFTLHGVTKEITVSMDLIGQGEDPWGGYRRGYEGTFTINRSDYGMTNMMEAVKDEVRITVSIEATRQ